MICKIAMNGFLGRMGQSIFQESNNHQDVEITLGCDSDNKINSIEMRTIETPHWAPQKSTSKNYSKWYLNSTLSWFSHLQTFVL